MTKALTAALLLVASSVLTGPVAAQQRAVGPFVIGPAGPSAPSARPGVPATGLPAWLAGTWAMERGAEWADEMWLGPRGDTMLGMARSGFGPDVQGWQSLRIVRREGSLALLTQPKGGPAIEFPLSFESADAIEFANPANDFPQRIRYSRAGQLLTIEQSKIDGADAVRANYRPVQTGVD